MKTKVIKRVVVGILVSLFMFVGWGFMISPDYTGPELLEALQAGENVAGKTVEFKVKDTGKNPLGGYFVTSTDDVVFTSGFDPKATIGDTGKVTITEARNVLDIWMVTYTVN